MFGKYARFAVCLGIATTIAACHQNEAPNPAGVHEGVEVALNTTRTLVVKLTGEGASAARVNFAGKTLRPNAENIVTFQGAEKKGDLKVTGDGLIEQNIKDLDFGDRTSMVIEIDVVSSVSTNIIPQANAENGDDVTNDSGNQSRTGVTSKLNVGTGGTAPAYAGTERDYSLVVYTPAAAPIPVSETVPNHDYNLAPYAVDCQPSGTEFDPAHPAHIELTIPGLGEIGNHEDVAFRFDGEHAIKDPLSKVVEGDVLKADVTHFSAWNVFINAKCTGISEDTEILKAGSLSAGDNKIDYTEFVGFESDVKGILYKWVKLLFGATKTGVNKSTTINAPSVGSFTISQKKFTISFLAGNKPFSVVAYGETTCTVNYTGDVTPDTKPVPVPTHNGGSSD